MRIHAILHGSRANGPGLRSVLWTQGCRNLNCPGCQNPQTHDPTVGREIEPGSLASTIWQSMPAQTEGITISGGEPMQQDIDLMQFVQDVHYIQRDLSIGLFTGYTEAELIAMPLWPRIRKHLDWALMGRWDRTQPAAEGFAPSRNQVLRIWRRYTPADFQRLVEFSIDEGGLTQVTGFPGKGRA